MHSSVADNSGVHSSAATNLHCASKSDNDDGQEVSILTALRRFLCEKQITSTAALVQALNTTRKRTTIDAVLAFLRSYISEFKHQYSLSFHHGWFDEYSELAVIEPYNDQTIPFLENYFTNLCDAIHEKYFKDKQLMTLLCTVLRVIDLRIFGRDPALLMKLVYSLLEQLKSEIPPSSGVDTFIAVHQAIIDIQEIAPEQLEHTNKNGFCEEIKKAMEYVRSRTDYYPYLFYAAMIEASIASKRKPFSVTSLFKDIVSQMQHADRLQRRGSSGSAVVSETVTHFKFEKRIGMNEATYVVLHVLSDCCLPRKKGTFEEEQFQTNVQTAVKYAETLNGRDQHYMLWYGIIDQLRRTIRQTDSDKFREVVAERLILLGQNLSAKARPEQIYNTYFDAMQCACAFCECREDILKEMRRLEGIHGKLFANWLGDEDLEGKLAKQDEVHNTESLCLFDALRSVFGVPYGVKEIMYFAERLKLVYTAQFFTMDRTLIGGGSTKHLDCFKFRLVAYYPAQASHNLKAESTRETTDPWHDARQSSASFGAQMQDTASILVRGSISLSALFARKSNKRHGAEEEIRTVFVYGDPGCGKTSLGKRIAHDWAKGKWGKEFERVYRLEMEGLRKEYDRGKRDLLTILVESIACKFYPSLDSSSDYGALKDLISDELAQPSTLLILDDFTDPIKDAKIIDELELDVKCKALLIGRYRAITDVTRRIDLLIECLGMTEAELVEYIQTKFSDYDAGTLLKYLVTNEVIWSLARIPVMANFICQTYKESKDSFKGEMKMSMYVLFEHIVELLWSRYSTKGHSRAKDVFRVLGKLALRAFSEDIWRISSFVYNREDLNDGLKDAAVASGLLVDINGSDIRFQHASFQDYFTAMHLCRDIAANKTDKEAESQRLRWISNNKYLSKAQMVLALMGQAFCKKSNEEGLFEFLDILDQAPVEVMGVQHLMLKIRIVDACLSCFDRHTWAQLAKNCRIRALLKSVQVLFESIAQNRSPNSTRRLRDIAASIGDLPNVVEHFRDIISPIVRQDSDSETSLGGDEWVMELAKHSPKQLAALSKGACSSNSLIQLVECGAFQAAILTCPELAWAGLGSLERKYGEANEHSCEHWKQLCSCIRDAGSKQRWGARVYALESCPDNAFYQVWAEAFFTAAAVDSKILHEFTKPEIGCGELEIRALYAAAPSACVDRVMSTISVVDNDNSAVCCTRCFILHAIVGVDRKHAPNALKELQPMLGDERDDVRLAAVRALSAIISVDPSLAKTVWPTLENLYTERHTEIRSVLIAILEQVLQIEPLFGDQVLRLAAKMIEDNSANTSTDVGNMLVAVAATNPELASKCLEKALAMCPSQNGSNYWGILSTISTILKAAPSLASDCLTTALKLREINDSRVRQMAASILGYVTKADPCLADDVLYALSRLLHDASCIVHSAVEALHAVAVSAPQLAERLLSILTPICKSRECDEVRLEAVSVLGTIACTEKRNADKVLETASCMLEDDEWEVRKEAVDVLGIIATTHAKHLSIILGRLSPLCRDSSDSVRWSVARVFRVITATFPRFDEVLCSAGSVEETMVTDSKVQDSLPHLRSLSAKEASKMFRDTYKLCDDEYDEVSATAWDVMDNFAVQAVLKLHQDTSEEKVSDIFLAYLLIKKPLCIEENAFSIPRGEIERLIDSAKAAFSGAFPRLLASLQTESGHDHARDGTGQGKLPAQTNADDERSRYDVPVENSRNQSTNETPRSSRVDREPPEAEASTSEESRAARKKSPQFRARMPRVMVGIFSVLLAIIVIRRYFKSKAKTNRSQTI